MDKLKVEDRDVWGDLMEKIDLSGSYETFISPRAIAALVRENEQLHSAIGNLEPLRDFDWHGKWRIQSVLDAVNQNKHSDTSGGLGTLVHYTDGTPSREWDDQPTKTPSDK